MVDFVWNSIVEANSRNFSRATSAVNDPILSLLGVPFVSGKAVLIKFDGGLLLSDGSVLALREIERRLRIAVRILVIMNTRRTQHACQPAEAFGVRPVISSWEFWWGLAPAGTLLAFRIGLALAPKH